MKKILIILFCLLPFILFGQSTFVKQVVSGNNVLFYRGTTSTNPNGLFNVLNYGAVGDSTTLDQTSVQAAIDAAEANGGGVVYFPKGIYRINHVHIPNKVSMIGDHAKIVGTASTANEYLFTISGNLLSNTTLTSDGILNENHVHVTSITPFTIGDYIVISDSTYTHGALGKNQEFNVIDTITAGILTLRNRLIGTYDTDETDRVYRYSPVTNCVIQGFTFEVPEGVKGGGVSFELAYDCKIIDCYIENGYLLGIQVARSANISIINNKIVDGQGYPSSHGYGFCFYESSHNCLVYGNYIENVRENPISNNSRYIRVENNVFRNCYADAVNTHGTGVSYISIVGNLIDGGCNSAGITVGGNEVKDHDVLIANNHIINVQKNGIDIVNTALGAELERISVLNNDITYFGRETAGTDYGIYVRNAIDVRIDGNMINGADGAAADYGIYLHTDIDIVISNNVIEQIPAGLGIGFESSDQIKILNNDFRDINSNNIYNAAATTNVFINGNIADDNTNNYGDAVVGVNNWGGYFITTFIQLVPQASPPTVAAEGQVYMDTDHHLYVHNGTGWIQLDN